MPLQHRPKITSLPSGIRHQIWKHTLICKSQSIPYLHDGTKVTPSLLRTCKQIYNEACPILYSENEFLINGPERVLKWLEQIGPANVEHLRRLRIFIDANYSREPETTFGVPSEISLWYVMVDRLARTATGLKNVYIFRHYEPIRAHRGVGKVLRLVRALGRIQGLEGMSIGGHYSKQWPEYLAGKMGVKVREAGCGELETLWLRQYQRGTENLSP